MCFKEIFPKYHIDEAKMDQINMLAIGNKK